MLNFNRILCFHSISNEGYNFDKFVLLIKFLKILGVRIISLNEMIESKPKGRNVSLTFDDGYKDNFEVLLPYLVDQGIHATLFIGPSLFIEEYTKEDRHNLGLKNIEIGNRSDIDKWIEADMSLGFHTVNHKDYSALSELEIDDDFKIGLSQFKELTGKAPEYFAFPFGFLPRNIPHYINSAKRNGIKYSFTVNWGDIKESGSDLFVNRVCIGDKDGVLWSIIKAIGLIDFYYYLIKINPLQRVMFVL